MEKETSIMRKAIGFLLSIMMILGFALADAGQDVSVHKENIDTEKISSETGLDEEIIKAYMIFIQTKEYGKYLKDIPSYDVDYPDPITRYEELDMASLYDFDHDGIPELLIQTVYGYDEMLDAFSYYEGNVKWLGNVGRDDNFYQKILCYDNSGIAGKVYAFIGGVRESIFEYAVDESGLTEREIGTTVFDYEQDRPTDVKLYIEDEHLKDLLYETGTFGDDHGERFVWNYIDSMSTEEDWILLFSGERRIGYQRTQDDAE